MRIAWSRAQTRPYSYARRAGCVLSTAAPPPLLGLLHSGRRECATAADPPQVARRLVVKMSWMTCIIAIKRPVVSGRHAGP